jgi:hypothetical protein
LLLLLCALGWVSATLQIVFPAPTAAAGWTLWGLSYDQWRDTQFVVLCLFALNVLLHVILRRCDADCAASLDRRWRDRGSGVCASTCALSGGSRTNRFTTSDNESYVRLG